MPSSSAGLDSQEHMVGSFVKQNAEFDGVLVCLSLTTLLTFLPEQTHYYREVGDKTGTGSQVVWDYGNLSES